MPNLTPTLRPIPVLAEATSPPFEPLADIDHKMIADDECVTCQS